MNLHFGGRADRGPVTGVHQGGAGGRAAHPGGPQRSEGRQRRCADRLAPPGPRGRTGQEQATDTKEAAPSAARVRSGGIGSVNRPSAAIGIVFEEDFEVGIVELVSG